jgi:hypothetical protein
MNCPQKTFENQKALGAQWLRTYYFKIISKGEFKKIMNS